MLQENVVIEVEKRTETGKNACNRLRAKDLIPAVLYGGHSGAESLPLSVARKDLLALFRKGLHQNAVFRVHVKGADEQPHRREVARCPVERLAAVADPGRYRQPREEANGAEEVFELAPKHRLPPFGEGSPGASEHRWPEGERGPFSAQLAVTERGVSPRASLSLPASVDLHGGPGPDGIPIRRPRVIAAVANMGASLKMVLAMGVPAG